MSYIIVGIICAVFGFGGGVFVTVRYWSNWLHAIEGAYLKADSAVGTFVEKLFLWMKGSL